MNDEQSLAPRAGSLVGNYDLQTLLGSGRLGEVHSAGNVVTRELVAVKLMARELCADEKYRAQFRRANELAARLPEPHAVPIRDWGEIGSQLYVEMELVEGYDLRRLLAMQGPLTAEQAVAAIEQVASVLDSAHANGLVHGDVKPENLLLTRSGFWQVTDFGLLPDGSGEMSGTPTYAPPERANGFPPSPSGDVYALACLLRECLTGTPVTAGPPGELGGFENVFARGTAANPNERFGNATALARSAREVLTQLTATASVAADPLPLAETELPVQPEPLTEKAWSEAPAPHDAGWQQSRAEVAWSEARHEAVWSGAPAEGSSPPSAQYHGDEYSYDPAPAKRSKVFPVMFSLLAVAILALGGIVGWLLFSGTNNDSGTTSPTAAAAPAQPNPSAPAPTNSATPALPAGAKPCPPASGASGSYTRSATGNATTSCPFAEEVRAAYDAAGAHPRQITATSPVTGKSYTMSCTASGQVVTCTGGTNAVVHLY